jgi:hypothetical protein
VNPLGLLGQDAAVSHCVFEVGSHLVESVHSFPEHLVVGASVSNHDLRGVFVGHDDGWLGKSGSERVGVVGLEGFLLHACVDCGSLPVSRPIQQKLES